MTLLPPDKGGRGGSRKKGERSGEEGKGIKRKGGEEDFRTFPQFQICYYTTVYVWSTQGEPTHCSSEELSLTRSLLTELVETSYVCEHAS